MVTFLYNGTYSDQHGEEDWENLSHKSWEAEKINAEPSRQPTWRDNLPVPAHFSKSLQTTASYTNCSLSTDNPQSKPEETSCPSKKPSKQELTYTSTQDDPEDRLQYSSFVVNVRMWALADKYDIKILKRLALTYFKERVDQSDWDFPNFCLAARELYQLPSSISRSFRDLVVERAANVRKALYDWNEFHELMNDVPEFTRDLLLCMWAQTDENERRTKLAEFARLKKT
ncbi:MAG: hypothetical protein M1819_004588 [Sarea resinae]|nr:MAG: hypothetical protein M1819_006809 [Sarea resinae]KAI9832044.1 MAG: hypothetical protein M1819_004588 [Sarea resinae]